MVQDVHAQPEEGDHVLLGTDGVPRLQCHPIAHLDHYLQELPHPNGARVSVHLWDDGIHDEHLKSLTPNGIEKHSLLNQPLVPARLCPASRRRAVQLQSLGVLRRKLLLVRLHLPFLLDAAVGAALAVHHDGEGHGHHQPSRPAHRQARVGVLEVGRRELGVEQAEAQKHRPVEQEAGGADVVHYVRVQEGQLPGPAGAPDVVRVALPEHGAAGLHDPGLLAHLQGAHHSRSGECPQGVVYGPEPPGQRVHVGVHEASVDARRESQGQGVHVRVPQSPRRPPLHNARPEYGLQRVRRAHKHRHVLDAKVVDENKLCAGHLVRGAERSQQTLGGHDRIVVQGIDEADQRGVPGTLPARRLPPGDGVAPLGAPLHGRLAPQEQAVDVVGRPVDLHARTPVADAVRDLGNQALPTATIPEAWPDARQIHDLMHTERWGRDFLLGHVRPRFELGESVRGDRHQAKL
mmetsp:Transcript_87411/g.247640  ORF Transcript_87411/g.247640 Transcript_87411/m.247640 type:complete len:462 (-) Transcript_87411:24-1409(-)